MKPALCLSLILIASVALAADKPAPKLPERRTADLALGKYKQDMAVANKAYEEAVAKARKQLSDNYDIAINSSMKRGAAGLDLANQLNAERKLKLDEDSHAEGAEVAGPTLEQIIAMLEGKKYFLSWEPGTNGGTAVYSVKRLKVLVDGQPKYNLERRWIVIDPGASIFVPVNDRTLRGFWVPTGRQLGLELQKD
jgi:hypothetical protein